MREDGFYWALVHSTFDQCLTPLKDSWQIVRSQKGNPVFWGSQDYRIIEWGEKTEKGLGGWKSKVLELKALPSQPGPYNQTPPNSKSLETAFSVISAIFFTSGVLPSRLFSSVEGGVGAYYFGISARSTRYCYFECYNDGEVVFAASSRQHDPQVFKVRIITLLEGDLWDNVDKFLKEELEIIPIPELFSVDEASPT